MPKVLLGEHITTRTNRERHGQDYYHRIGSIGGKAPHRIRGFAMNRELARVAGTIGGYRSRSGNMKTDFKTIEIAKAYAHLLDIKQKADEKRKREAMTILQ